MKFFYLYAGKKYHLLVFLFLVMVMVVGQYYKPTLQYDRLSIINGDYWRVLTCHFSHVSWWHLLLNLIGFVFVFLLFFQKYSPAQWVVAAFFCSVFIAVGFLAFSPNLNWYLGFSGLLHAFFVMGLVGEIKEKRKIYYIFLAAVFVKVLMEKYVGPSAYMRGFLDFRVVADAHVLGVLSGLSYSFMANNKTG